MAMKKLSELFNGVKAQTLINVNENDNHPLIPEEDPNYQFPPLIIHLLLWLISFGGKTPVCLSGPTGSGKSSIFTQIAARLRTRLYVVSCHENMQIEDLFGHYVVSNGSTIWRDGPFIAGIKDENSAFVLLDEYDSLPQTTLTGLNALIEGRTFIVPQTGEYVNATTFGAKIIFCGNTLSDDDEELGTYLGTNKKSPTFKDRVIKHIATYPAPTDVTTGVRSIEEAVLEAKVPQLPENIRIKFVEIANMVRAMYLAGETGVIFSTRTLVLWAELTVEYKRVKYPNPIFIALDQAIANGYSSEQRNALHETVNMVIKETKP